MKGISAGRLTYLLTYPMQNSLSWESNRFSGSQEIPRILWNPKIHYGFPKYPPPVPILRQLDPFHAPTYSYLMIDLNIIIPSTPENYRWSLSLKFSHQNPVYTYPLPHMCYMPCPFHSSRFITRTIFGEAYRSLISTLRSFLYSPVTSSLLGPNIHLNILFSNTLRLHSSLSVSDQVSHPYKTTGKNIFNYILIFKFLDSKLEDKRFCTKCSQHSLTAICS